MLIYHTDPFPVTCTILSDGEVFLLLCWTLDYYLSLRFEHNLFKWNKCSAEKHKAKSEYISVQIYLKREVGKMSRMRYDLMRSHISKTWSMLPPRTDLKKKKKKHWLLGQHNSRALSHKHSKLFFVSFLFFLSIHSPFHVAVMLAFNYELPVVLKPNLCELITTELPYCFFIVAYYDDEFESWSKITMEHNAIIYFY